DHWPLRPGHSPNLPVFKPGGQGYDPGGTPASTAGTSANHEGARPMSFKMQRVHVFHAQVEDKPGGISGKLKRLAEAGAHLEYVYSQRSDTKPGVGDLYVAPLHGNGEVAAARAAGMHEVSEPIVMRVEGDDRAGLGGRLTQAW